MGRTSAARKPRAGTAAVTDARRYAPALPAVLVERMLSFCAGDVTTLCAAACVSRAWRDAAALPALLRSIDLGRWRQRSRAQLNARRLKALLARSRSGDLERLDLCDCDKLRVRDVLKALDGRRVTKALLVDGVHADASSVQRGSEVNLASLRAVLAPGARLDAVGMCGLQGEDGVVCTRLCSSEHCEICGTFYCAVCMGGDDEPDCEHECSRCTHVGEGLADCANPDCEHVRGNNGFCPDCRGNCQACDAIVCDICLDSYDDKSCEVCAGNLCPACARYSKSADEYFCKACYSDRQETSSEEEAEEEEEEEEEEDEEEEDY